MGCDRFVYSINVPGSPPTISYEHIWEFRGASGPYGLEQYSYWVDSKGEMLAGDEIPKQPKKTHKTFTAFWLGSHNLTIPVNIWVTTALSLTALVLGCWLLVAAANGMVRRKPAESRK